MKCLSCQFHAILFASVFLLSSCNAEKKYIIDLSGTWEFRMDPEDRGIAEDWHMSTFDETVSLPGSMLTNGKGYDVAANTKWTGGIWDSTWFYHPDFAKYREPGNVKVAFGLQPLKYYTGPASVGKGKLLVSGADLITDAVNRPEARQLLHSLRKYMVSESFDPAVTVDSRKIVNLIIKN